MTTKMVRPFFNEISILILLIFSSNRFISDISFAYNTLEHKGSLVYHILDDT